MNQGKCINENRLISALASYDVIFLGDHHDSVALHQRYADILTQLQDRGYRIHLANEWFTPQQNKLLFQYAHQNIDDANFSVQSDFNKSVGYPFESFVPIYHSVIEGKGELYGLNLSPKERHEISDDNISAMKADVIALYYSLDTNVSAHQQMIAPYLQHCHAPHEGESEKACLKRMYKVQVAWDEKMGLEAAKLAKKVLLSPADKLVVFVGALHVEQGLGVSMRFARHSNKTFALVSAREEPVDTLEHKVADFILFYK